MDIRLVQSKVLPSEAQFARIGNWILLAREGRPGCLGDFAYADLLWSRYKQAAAMPAGGVLEVDLPNRMMSHVAYSIVCEARSSFEWLGLSRSLVACHARFRPSTLGIVVHGFQPDEAERIAEAVIAAILASYAPLPCFKKRPSPPPALTRIRLFGMHSRHGFKRTFAEAEGNALSRGLSALPSNLLTPTIYLKKIRQLAREQGWKVEFMDSKVLKKRRAGAFLAVAQGSPKDDAGIVRIRYTHHARNGKPTRPIALVGKGICYDTGGVNLKPANHMFGMHEDMQGSSVALGTLLALSKLRYPCSVECWLALATNHIGPRAYKPNDVVTAANGTTIEVVHTDAEGRMVLADTLVLASQGKPRLILDFATLTGACVYAIGTAYSGLFTNRLEWMPRLVEAGRDCGERVWPFPLDKDFDTSLSSEVADIKQCARTGGADHILAARFLQRFVLHDTPWIHLDLSASRHKGGLAHIPTESTGFGVRYALQLLLQKRLF